MPIKERECTNKDCDYKEEVIVITEQDREELMQEKICPKCGSPLQKVMSVTAKGIVK